MNRALLPLLAFAMAGCDTTLYNPRTGGKLAVMRSDITNGSYSGGGVKFTFDKMSNSVPTRATMLGANNIVKSVASGVATVAVPGTGVAPDLTRTVISTVPHFIAPKDNAGQ